MRGFSREILVLMGAALLPAGAAAWLHPRSPSWISEEVRLEVAGQIGGRVLWVDVRAPEDYAAGHIPGAVGLHGEGWDEGLGQLLDQWTEGRVVVVYCSRRSCQTSHLVARRLREEVGLSDVRVLDGGWEAWKEAHP